MTTGVIVPMEALPLAQIPAAEAPSVLWDVGLDLLDYPEFYNAQRDGGLVSQDAAFWNELIDDNYQSMEGLFLLPNTKETDVGVTLNQSLVGGGVSSDFGNKDVVALHETAGEYFGFQGLKFVCVCKTASCSHKGKVFRGFEVFCWLVKILSKFVLRMTIFMDLVHVCNEVLSY